MRENKWTTWEVMQRVREIDGCSHENTQKLRNAKSSLKNIEAG